VASWTTNHATVAAPAPRARPRKRPAAAARSRRRARGGVLWIAISAVLLAGVVFVNVAVLQLNLRLDDATRQRAKLRAENAARQSQLSRLLASPRIQARAMKEQHLRPADPADIGYVDLSR
jgi:cell division protein FtsL